MFWKCSGWILFAWGTGGILATIAVIVFQKSTELWIVVVSFLLCALYIWGGWNLSHSKKIAQYTPGASRTKVVSSSDNILVSETKQAQETSKNQSATE